ncbi:hypothetical protein CGMCC3_g17514 [Colletotrichum fructicola]|uniref:Uncharacterized protein n=1 Tax=Colletotrichum fructicola (strain Nara gc5) TaxID=1213859 RepID=A0A7J6IVM7_COLFN|nr:uncharacterized protein CGMCC3_g17514 [Colletotrichum fructicola]KAF4479852.1 hypothetical protein CGGC5_v011771 [Colletotrichum fructicola Nara gc5]KAI8281866.1 hypothetical protein K4K60_003924 [Colletotrichum sp. SAR11_57]KAE9566330.1 hypothetical protein CGMCC3_g17514 [Colletotrichum fructicola]KAF4434451.1 hypothetical protein CFRS1_v014199 [Colletotrichum fructicola]KAF5490124.1 hypothetical protein CGCF413_v010757 [Colletotrichum fructicola]
MSRQKQHAKIQPHDPGKKVRLRAKKVPKPGKPHRSTPHARPAPAPRTPARVSRPVRKNSSDGSYASTNNDNDLPNSSSDDSVVALDVDDDEVASIQSQTDRYNTTSSRQTTAQLIRPRSSAFDRQTATTSPFRPTAATQVRLQIPAIHRNEKITTTSSRDYAAVIFLVRNGPVNDLLIERGKRLLQELFSGCDVDPTTTSMVSLDD